VLGPHVASAERALGEDGEARRRAGRGALGGGSGASGGWFHGSPTLVSDPWSVSDAFVPAFSVRGVAHNGPMRFAAGDTEVLEAAKLLCAGTEELARDRRVDALSAQAAEALFDVVIRNERANTALKLRLAARFAENHGAKAADDLAKKTGTSKGKAKRTVETAKKLRDQPEVEDALRNGELSEDQAELIADAVDANPSAAGGLLKKAKDHPIDDLRQECGRAKAAADGDEDATHARIHRNRSWRTGTNAEGAFWGSALGTTVDGADFSAHPPTVPRTRLQPQPQSRHLPDLRADRLRRAHGDGPHRLPEREGHAAEQR